MVTDRVSGVDPGPTLLGIAGIESNRNNPRPLDVVRVQRLCPLNMKRPCGTSFVDVFPTVVDGEQFRKDVRYQGETRTTCRASRFQILMQCTVGEIILLAPSGGQNNVSPLWGEPNPPPLGVDSLLFRALIRRREPGCARRRDGWAATPQRVLGDKPCYRAAPRRGRSHGGRHQRHQVHLQRQPDRSIPRGDTGMAGLRPLRGPERTDQASTRHLGGSTVFGDGPANEPHRGRPSPAAELRHRRN